MHAVQPLRHRDVGLDAETAGLQAAHEADGRPLFAPVEAAGEQQGEGGMQRCRQARRAHQEFAGELEAQRRALEQGIGIGADGAHQAQGFGVGADQDVLAVVDVEAVDFCCAGATAEGTRGFEDLDLMAGGSEFDGGRHPGIAGADDRELQAIYQVFPASHSLRSGGSEMRWSSTR